MTEQLKKFLDSLPRGITADEAYELYFKYLLDKSMDDLENGRYRPIEEFEKELEAKLETYNVRRS